MTRLLLRVQMPYFTAGAEAEAGRVVKAAPVLEWAVGKSVADLARWVLRRKGEISVVEREGP